MKKDLQPSYEGSYKIVNRTEKVFWILRYGKDVSSRNDRLKPTYVSKVDIPVGVHRKEKVPSRPNEVLDTGEENSTGCSSIAKNLANPGGGLPVAIVVCCRR
ncbi:hypothetical protein NPIL_614721 [Nephila pilipes]|uniref:Uncharacterized protein n=1 Tax=Nephila pilipes TaxID=299642 RepID=A0A8X6QV53_NEPPI|nr:hypothetical protein NPIL_614721 [Nephila pilipes]